MLEMLGPLANAAVTQVLKLGLDKWQTSKELRVLRQLLRERLAREMRFNVEWHHIAPLNQQQIIECYDTSTTQELFRQPLPLSMLFPKELDQNIIDNMPSNILGLNHKNWIRPLTNEAELIERFWHRYSVTMFKIRKKLGHGDLKYVMGLASLLQAHVKRPL